MWRLPPGWKGKLSTKGRWFFWHESNPSLTTWTEPTWTLQEELWDPLAVHCKTFCINVTQKLWNVNTVVQPLSAQLDLDLKGMDECLCVAFDEEAIPFLQSQGFQLEKRDSGLQNQAACGLRMWKTRWHCVITDKQLQAACNANNLVVVQKSRLAEMCAPAFDWADTHEAQQTRHELRHMLESFDTSRAWDTFHWQHANLFCVWHLKRKSKS